MLKKKTPILTSTREGGAKGQGFDGLQENRFEELNATIGVIVWSPMLGMKIQHVDEAVAFIGAHNLSWIGQR